MLKRVVVLVTIFSIVFSHTARIRCADWVVKGDDATVSLDGVNISRVSSGTVSMPDILVDGVVMPGIRGRFAYFQVSFQSGDFNATIALRTSEPVVLPSLQILNATFLTSLGEECSPSYGCTYSWLMGVPSYVGREVRVSYWFDPGSTLWYDGSPVVIGQEPYSGGAAEDVNEASVSGETVLTLCPPTHRVVPSWSSDGVYNNERLDRPSGDAIPGSGDSYTLAIYFKGFQQTGTTIVFGWGTSKSTSRLAHIGFRSGNQFLGHYGDDHSTSIQMSFSEDWHWWFYLYDQATNTQITYRDTTLTGTRSCGTFNPSSTITVMGSYQSNEFAGHLREMRLYTQRLLTPGEMEGIVNGTFSDTSNLELVFDATKCPPDAAVNTAPGHGVTWDATSGASQVQGYECELL